MSDVDDETTDATAEAITERVGWLSAEVKQARAERNRARAQLGAVGLCWGCAYPHRETVGMVCQVCGTDYGEGPQP